MCSEAHRSASVKEALQACSSRVFAFFVIGPETTRPPMSVSKGTYVSYIYIQMALMRASSLHVPALAGNNGLEAHMMS